MFKLELANYSLTKINSSSSDSENLWLKAKLDNLCIYVNCDYCYAWLLC